jgi:hypothetical protein
MLDKRTLKLLDILNNECQGSGYKVFSLVDLALSLPERLKMDEFGVRECLSVLATREYISVKYEDEKEICLRPLSKGRFVFENRIDEEIEKNKWAKKYLIFSALGSFVGSGVAIAIAQLMTLIFGGRAIC